MSTADLADVETVVRTIATENKGVAELARHIELFRKHFEQAHERHAREMAHWKEWILQLLETRLMERVLGPQLGDFIRALHEEHGVIFHLGETVTAFDGRRAGFGFLVWLPTLWSSTFFADAGSLTAWAGNAENWAIAGSAWIVADYLGQKGSGVV